MKQKLITMLVGVCIAGAIAFFVAPSYRQGEPSLNGRPAKDFAFQMDGKQMHLSDLRGHLVVLNFWASWCQPCVEEAPSLNMLHRRIAPMGGMVLAIDAGVDENEQAYKQFLKTYQIDYPAYLDLSKQIAASYGTLMYPETYIINPDGKLERKIVGAQDWTSPEMVSYLASLMPKTLPPQVGEVLP